ncbi:hypothetical protein PSACC_02560 [Paramicrosporidium saccamoebae]|uniref:SCP domain-containing protein n=1 Tax=Paramicrosporidium saccamoebae TaxID=1246581 RepID=A0A2H9TIN1_9FUNG|nr:hypothetical protein PSACC_02560 [Paramicrosporidium saccamoebae]
MFSASRVMRLFVFLGLFALFGLIALAEAQDYVSDMLQAVNQLRLQRREANPSLQPVCISERLTSLTRQYAELQASRQQGGHYVDGQFPKIRYSVEVAENLFEGYAEAGADRAQSVLTTMIRTPGQLQNLMDPGSTHIGVGRATSERDGTTYYYWVVVLAQTRERCGRAGESLAEMIAPPESRRELQHSFWEPVAGGGGIERVEEVQRTYLDTMPRVDESGANHQNLPQGDPMPQDYMADSQQNTQAQQPPQYSQNSQDSQQYPQPRQARFYRYQY